MQERGLGRKDRSTVGRDEYIWDHIVFGGIFGFNLYKLLPVVAPIAYYHQSLARLVICVVVASVIGILLSYKYNRTNLGMMADILLGLGSYVVLTIGVYKPGLIKALLIASVVFTVISLFSIFTSKIKRPDKIKQIILNRIRRSFLLVRRNAGVACGFALIAVPVAVHFTSSEKIVTQYYDIVGIEAPYSPFEDEYEVAQAYDDRYQLSENIDVIKKIRNNDEFQTLTYEEKYLDSIECAKPDKVVLESLATLESGTDDAGEFIEGLDIYKRYMDYLNFRKGFGKKHKHFPKFVNLDIERMRSWNN